MTGMTGGAAADGVFPDAGIVSEFLHILGSAFLVLTIFEEAGTGSPEDG